MANLVRGEIEAELDGKTYTLCLPLGELARMEEALGASHLAGLADHFSGGTLRASELTQIIAAGLRGGGNAVSISEVEAMQVDGGVSGFVRIAAQLLAATFTPLEAD